MRLSGRTVRAREVHTLIAAQHQGVAACPPPDTARLSVLLSPLRWLDRQDPQGRRGPSTGPRSAHVLPRSHRGLLRHRPVPVVPARDQRRDRAAHGGGSSFRPRPSRESATAWGDSHAGRAVDGRGCLRPVAAPGVGEDCARRGAEDVGRAFARQAASTHARYRNCCSRVSPRNARCHRIASNADRPAENASRTAAIAAPTWLRYISSPLRTAKPTTIAPHVATSKRGISPHRLLRDRKGTRR